MGHPRAKAPIPTPMPGENLRGATRLVIDAVLGVTGMVETMHRNISRVAPVVGQSRQGPTTGITGLVYRSVRGVSQAVGGALDAALVSLGPRLSGRPTRASQAVQSALNGAFGDYLVAQRNPLAMPMQLRHAGRALRIEQTALEQQFAHAKGKLIVLVHGLCMNDLQWQHKGHNHGATLAHRHDCEALYLRYNTGLNIADNGREFADLLERLVANWPVRVESLIIVGHSMGGLVARSACHHAALAKHRWPQQLKKWFCLGTPHHGAPLERGGYWVEMLLGVSPYTRPFARLSGLRSAGVRDLRHGRVVGRDAASRSQRSTAATAARQRLTRAGLAKCHVIAATTQPAPPADARTPKRAPRPLPGDGLVPVKSALGQHADPALALNIPASRQHVCYATNHLDLLSRSEVCERISRWL